MGKLDATVKLLPYSESLCCAWTQAFAPDGSILKGESNTALIDQLVSIVQHVLETKVEGALEHLVHVKIDDIVLNLIM